MAASLGSPRGGTISSINVTPLVDVVLVLLIVLMVTATSIVAESIPMDLPEAATGEASGGTLVLSLDQTGQLFLDGEAIELAALPREIETRAARLNGSPDQRREQLRAVIAADRGVAHGSVVVLMDSLRKEGVARFAISVRPSDLATSTEPSEGSDR